MNLLEDIVARAKSDKQRIVLPEATEERTLRAADRVLADDIANLILIGNPEEIKTLAEKWDLHNIDKATIVDPENNPKAEEYATLLAELRKKKGMTIEQARELVKNLALRVQPYEDTTDKWIVSGRGVLHLSVLIETMRREGYELQVGQPQVIYKEIDGVKCEPIEELTINVPEEFASKMIDMVTRRKGDMTSMLNMGDRVDIEFDIPSRGIIGLRTNVLTAFSCS